jgi:hypothetical protein
MSDTVLARRLTELEGEVAGEKVVTRHILDKLRANTDILLQIQRAFVGLRQDMTSQIGGLRQEMTGEIGGLRQEVIGLHQKVDKLADRVALQEAHLLSFEAKFAHIAAQALREALKSRGD